MRIAQIIRSLCFAAWALVAASPAWAQDANAEIDQLYAKVKASSDKRLVIFSAYPTMPAILNKFRQDFPDITVAHEVASGATLSTRLQAEKTSGRYGVDVVVSGPFDILELEERGLLQPYIPHSADKLAPDLKSKSGVISVPFRNLFALMYNSNLVPEKDAPATLDQALDKKWSGKIAYAKPTGSNAFDMSAAILWYNQKLTVEQLQKIHDLGRGMQTNTDTATYVAQGRMALGIWGPSQTAWQLQQDKAPIRVKALRNATVLFGPGVSLLAHAPDADAGKLFMEWLYTPRGQAAVVAMTGVSTMPNAPTPPEYPDISDYQLKDIPLEATVRTVQEFRAKTKAIWTD